MNILVLKTLKKETWMNSHGVDGEISTAHRTPHPILEGTGFDLSLGGTFYSDDKQ